MPKVVIVGGGVSGLCVGLELQKAGFHKDDLVVLEASDRTGGNVSTLSEDGFTIERGPNGFLDNVPATIELARELGLGDEILVSNQTAHDRFIYRKNKLRKIEANPLKFLASGALPLGGALRVALEPFQRKAGGAPESVYDFASRRIGKEAASILVDSMVSGVFAGNSRRLELESAFPKMAHMEATHGGLVKAMMAKNKENKRSGSPAGPGGTLTSFKKGFQTLPDAMGDRLGDIVRLDSRVSSVKSKDGGYAVTISGGEDIEARAVLLACPAWASSKMVSELAPDLSKELGGITYPPVTVVATMYKGKDVENPPEGFGFLVPRGQGVTILGCLWTSSVWTGRAPEGDVLLRTMVGGAHAPDSARLGDDEILSLVKGELKKVMGLHAEPSSHRIFRYDKAIAQYEPGHKARLARMDESLAAHPGLFLSGSSYRGISVNHCIEEAPKVAAVIRKRLG